MDEHSRKAFTVQGRDIPVPFGSGVLRIGPVRPSAVDCPVPLVGDQARAHVTETGINVDEMAMEKAMEDPEEEINSKLQNKLLSLMKDIDWEVKKLVKIVSESQNTRRDIKDSCSTLRSLTSQMTTSDLYQLIENRPLYKNKETAVTEEFGSPIISIMKQKEEEGRARKQPGP